MPGLGLDSVSEWSARRELASRLFVTLPDLWPLMILIAALTGRSPEALKELPASHRVLDDAAARCRHWPISPPPTSLPIAVIWPLPSPARRDGHSQRPQSDTSGVTAIACHLRSGCLSILARSASGSVIRAALRTPPSGSRIRARPAAGLVHPVHHRVRA